MRFTIDIETALCEELTRVGLSASAHMIPATLGKNMPHVHIVRTGGYESGMVVETNQVDFDVYDADAADAMESATELCAKVRDLEGGLCYRALITTLPYPNPDPRHPSLARATFKAQLITRTL